MKKRTKITGGFSLVEVTLALGVASFSMVTLMALLPVGLQHYQRADSQTTMVNLTTMIVRDLEATPSGASTSMSPRFSFSVPGPGGTADASPQVVYVDASGAVATGNSRMFRINVAFSPPAAGSKGATAARILITWPALADPTTTAWPTKYVDMFETTVSFNRN